jgi:hypothetical protein
MSNELTVFDATKALQYVEQATAALEKATDVGEVKAIHKNAEALKAAARKLKDKTAEAAAHKIRMLAERTLGQLMKRQAETVGFNKGGGDKRSKHRDSKKPGGNEKPTLAEAGIDKTTANRARKEAAKSPEQFEQDVAAEKERITAPKPAGKPKSKKSTVVLGLSDRCVERVRAMVEDTVQQMQRGHAAQEKFMHLFAALKDLVDDLERKALARLESLTVESETVEESAEKRRMVNAKLAETESA